MDQAQLRLASDEHEGTPLLRIHVRCLSDEVVGVAGGDAGQDPLEQGITTILSVRKDPEEMGAPMSSLRKRQRRDRSWSRPSGQLKFDTAMGTSRHDQVRLDGELPDGTERHLGELGDWIPNAYHESLHYETSLVSWPLQCRVDGYIAFLNDVVERFPDSNALQGCFTVESRRPVIA